MTVLHAQADAFTYGAFATTNTIRNDTLSVRENPGINYTILERLPDGTRVQIIDGPVLADGYTWWQVIAPSGTTGWSVESADGIQTLLPVATNTQFTSPSDLDITGQLVYVTEASLDTNDIHLFSASSTSVINDVSGSLCPVVLSGDGRMLLYEGVDANYRYTTMLHMLHTGEEVEIASSDLYGWTYDWLPNHGQIIFSGSDTLDSEPVPIWLYDLSTQTTSELIAPQDWHPAYIETSYDGRYLAFNEFVYEGAGGDVVIVESTTGIIRQTLTAGLDYDWSSTDNQFAYTAGQNLRTIRPESQSPTLLYTSQGSYYLIDPLWSPDGRQLAFLETNRTERNGNRYISTLKRLDMTTLTISDILLPFRVATILDWSPDSQYLLVRDENFVTWIAATNADVVAPLGEIRCADWGNLATNDVIEGWDSLPDDLPSVQIRETSGRIQLLSEPFKDGQLIGQLVPGDYYEYLQSDAGWVQIRTLLGTGWAPGENVEVFELP